MSQSDLVSHEYLWSKYHITIWNIGHLVMSCSGETWRVGSPCLSPKQPYNQVCDFCGWSDLSIFIWRLLWETARWIRLCLYLCHGFRWLRKHVVNDVWNRIFSVRNSRISWWEPKFLLGTRYFCSWFNLDTAWTLPVSLSTTFPHSNPKKLSKAIFGVMES